MGAQTAAAGIRLSDESARLMRLATSAALGVAGLLFIIKAIVWAATDSVALLGSALDSGLDIVATGFNFLAVRHALQPPDREHRFGHGKAEAISGLAQGAFICGSAIFLMIQSLGRLFHPHTIDYAMAGITVTLFSLGITGVLVLFQRHVKARTGSLAISADELHYRSDIILNAGVLAAFLLSGPLMDLPLADPIIGAAIALNIARSAFSITRRSYDQLMDHEFGEDERARIAAIVKRHPEVIALHDLRTRRSGRDAFIQFHLEMAPGLKLLDAHRISDEVELAVRDAFPNAEVLIHEDPAGYEAPHTPLDEAAAR
jgi:ferrous-iron efflux pump FieF